jgi:hypothetical protein
MQEAQKSNVVQISDFAHRRGSATRIDRPAGGFSVVPHGDLYVFPRLHAP